MERNCDKCFQSITGIDSVACRGYCGGAFHMNCAGVSRAMMNYFTTHRNNLFWMCDKCANLFENSHLRAITNQADEKSPLTSLTEAITSLQVEIKKISSKPIPPISSPKLNRWPMISEPIRAAKRPRGHDNAVTTASACQSGSKQISQDVVSVPFIEKAASKFWLYISQIKPHVENEAISAMVRANLAMDTVPEVVKLVAKGTDTSNMTFVSFKVGLDPAMKDKALDPSNWPEGLMFRQFEEYGSQKFRKSSNAAPVLSPLIPNATPTVN